MGLCETVGLLAENVAKVWQTADPRFLLLVHILQSAPVYRNAGRLDAWDEAYRNARGDNTATVEIDLLDAIFGLGSENLYGAFDATVTQVVYKGLVSELSDAGVPTPAKPDLSGW